MRFATWVFRLAGLIGLLMVVPPYFLEAQMGRDDPPPVNHPEYYYGFLGLCVAWQLMFMVISSDPVRFRPAMGPAVLEKLAFVAAIPVLYALDRVSGRWLGFAAVDAVWLVLFIIAYVRTGGAARRFSDRKIPV